jgi:hypothetical protein
MGADKNSSRRSNSTYVPNSQPRIPTRVCQGCVVTADLPTLARNPKQSQTKSETKGANDLATLRTVRDDRADGPRVTGGRSENGIRTSSSAPRTIWPPQADCPTNFLQTETSVDGV